MRLPANRIDTVCIAFLSIGTWGYLWWRACHSPLVMDEAATWALYVNTGHFLPGSGFWSANNHLFFTAIAWALSQLLPPDPWALRLPALFAFPLFCYWLWRISQRLQSAKLRVGLFLAVFSLHYTLEFFAYARGYALAFAGMTGAIHFILAYANSGQLRLALAFLASIFMMLFSNLATLPVAAFLIFSLWLVKGAPIRRAGLWIGSLAVLGGGSWYIWQLKAKGELYYGSEDGLVPTTLISLAHTAMPGFENLAPGVLLLLGGLLLWGIWGLIRQKQPFRLLPVAFLALFAGTLFFFVVAHHLGGSPYPLERPVLYLWLLLIFALFFMADTQSERKGIVLSFPIMGFLVLWLFQWPGKFSYHPGWAQEQIPETFYRYTSQVPDATISGHYTLRYQWNHYKALYSSDGFAFSLPNSHHQTDFVIALISETDSLNGFGYHQELCASNRLCLFRQNSPTTFTTHFKYTTQQLWANGLYTGLLEWHEDTLPVGHSQRIAVAMRAQTNQFAGYLTLGTYDGSGQQIGFQDDLINASVFEKGLYQMQFALPPPLSEGEKRTFKLYVFQEYPKETLLQDVEILIQGQSGL
jgi:hypothetical protein